MVFAVPVAVTFAVEIMLVTLSLPLVTIARNDQPSLTGLLFVHAEIGQKMLFLGKEDTVAEPVAAQFTCRVL